PGTWGWAYDEALKVTVASHVQRPLASGTMTMSMRFSCWASSTPRSQLMSSPSLVGFGSVALTVTPCGIRLWTVVWRTGQVLTFLITIWNVAGWPSLIVGGPTHSRLTAGS